LRREEKTKIDGAKREAGLPRGIKNDCAALGTREKRPCETGNGPLTQQNRKISVAIEREVKSRKKTAARWENFHRETGTLLGRWTVRTAESELATIDHVAGKRRHRETLGQKFHLYGRGQNELHSKKDLQRSTRRLYVSPTKGTRSDRSNEWLQTMLSGGEVYPAT